MVYDGKRPCLPQGNTPSKPKHKRRRGGGEETRSRTRLFPTNSPKSPAFRSSPQTKVRFGFTLVLKSYVILYISF
jgi:hypothetical protein